MPHLKYLFIATLAATSFCSAQSINFTKDEGFSSASLDGQRGWLSGPTEQRSWKVDADSGNLHAKDTSIMLLDVPLKLKVGMSYSYNVTFQLDGDHHGRALPATAGEFWYLVRTGFKSNNGIEMDPKQRNSCEINVQAFNKSTSPDKNSLRLLNKDFKTLTSATDFHLETGVDYTIRYEIKMGNQAGSTQVNIALSDGNTEVEGMIEGVDPKLYSDLHTGNGAYLFLQSNKVSKTEAKGIIVSSISE